LQTRIDTRFEYGSKLGINATSLVHNVTYFRLQYYFL
jgi:hypothetical protein